MSVGTLECRLSYTAIGKGGAGKIITVSVSVSWSLCEGVWAAAVEAEGCGGSVSVLGSVAGYELKPSSFICSGCTEGA